MKRNLTLDIVKILAACGVVMAHAQFLSDIYPAVQYILFSGVLRFGIPLFLFITGYFFYSAAHNGYLKVWFKRLLILYAVWMLIYGVFWIRPDKYSFLEMLHFSFFGFWHLWYVSAIIIAAALTVLAYKLSLFKQLSLIVGLFLIGVCIQYAANYSLLSEQVNAFINNDWVHRNGLFLGFPFFFMGYLTFKYKPYESLSMNQCTAFLIIALFAAFLEASINYYHPERQGPFDNSLSLFISCPAVFFFFMKLPLEGTNKSLTLYAKGMYLSHPIVIIFANHFFDLSLSVITLLALSISPLITYFIIRIHRRVPIFL